MTLVEIEAALDEFDDWPIVPFIGGDFGEPVSLVYETTEGRLEEPIVGQAFGDQFETRMVEVEAQRDVVTAEAVWIIEGDELPFEAWLGQWIEAGFSPNGSVTPH